MKHRFATALPTKSGAAKVRNDQKTPTPLFKRLFGVPLYDAGHVPKVLKSFPCIQSETYAAYETGQFPVSSEHGSKSHRRII
jgi:hypothetical protein